MRVTLPTALRIGPHTYPVVVEDAPSCEGAAVWGLWDGPNLLVRFDAVLAEHPTKALETVLHECLHILEAGAGIEFREREVRSLATGLAALLIDNPALLAMARRAAKC